MTTVNKLIEEVKSKTNQNDDGQFEKGSEEHQYATRFVELFFTEYDNILEKIDIEDFPEMIAAVVNALRDLQVRDYMLGIISTVKNPIDSLEFIIEAAPEHSDPARALVSTIYYEQDRVEDAINTLKEADLDYPLAKLLLRVYEAGWPKESFVQMRNELHPKVVTTIFGKDN